MLWHDTDLSDALKLFKQGRAHIALVCDVEGTEGPGDPYYGVKGIVTLEVGQPEPPSMPCHSRLACGSLKGPRPDTRPRSQTHEFLTPQPSQPLSSKPTTYSDPSTPPTPQDVLEYILGGKITDETDEYMSQSGTADAGGLSGSGLNGQLPMPGSSLTLATRAERANFDVSRLRLLDSTLRDERLTVAEARAVSAFLLAHVEPFRELARER